MPIEEAIAIAQVIATPSEKAASTPPVNRADGEELGGFTHREREIAVLIAQSKSNSEIAEALVITKRTVETHISNILSKQGFTSRGQIAVWAIKNGLVNDL